MGGQGEQKWGGGQQEGQGEQKGGGGRNGGGESRKGGQGEQKRGAALCFQLRWDRAGLLCTIQGTKVAPLR